MRMELAAALHHSAYKGAVPETKDGLRSQKTVNSREDAVFFELYDEDTAGWRPPSLGEPPGTDTGSAAHRGADHRVLGTRADDRRSCAAVGGPVSGSRQVLRHAACCCRAGNRSDHDHS